MDEPSPQPDPAGEDPIDLKIAVQLQPRLNMRELGDEVGPFGIANDEVTNFLGAQANTVEMIACGYSAPLELTLQIMAGDRAALDPHNGDCDR